LSHFVRADWAIRLRHDIIVLEVPAVKVLTLGPCSDS